MATNGAKDVSYAVRMRAARLSATQFDVLIDFMRRHPTLALGRAACGSYSKEDHDSLWKSLAALLNETEGPAKSISKWQKCWVDLKSNARSRAAKLRASRIDGSVLVGATFTQWDEQVLILLGELNPHDSNGPMELQKSPSQLVEVPLTSGKVVLMEVNGSRRRTNTTNRSGFSSGCTKPINHYQDDMLYRKQDIKVEEPDDDNFNLIEEVHDGEESADLVTGLEEEEYDKNDEESMASGENEFLLCPSLMPIHTPVPVPIPMINPVSGCSPTKSKSSLCYQGNEDLLQEEDSRKRKSCGSAISNEVEDSLDRFSKKICAALERVASAAEQSNSLQRGMVNALERLSSTLEKIVPVLVKEVSKNSNCNTHNLT